MSDKYPQSYRDDLKPGKNPTAEKSKGESFNEAANPPNNPTKNKRPTSFNVSDDYDGIFD